MASEPASRSIASNAAQIRSRSDFEPVARGLLLFVELEHRAADESEVIVRQAAVRLIAAGTRTDREPRPQGTRCGDRR